MTTTASRRTTSLIGRAALAAVTAAAANLLAGCGASGSSGSCAAPEISASPIAVAAGAKVHVTGKYFTEGCDDQGKGGSSAPLQDQPVTFTQNGQVTTLSEVDSVDGGIDVTVTVPGTASRGPANLQLGYSSIAALIVT